MISVRQTTEAGTKRQIGFGLPQQNPGHSEAQQRLIIVEEGLVDGVDIVAMEVQIVFDDNVRLAGGGERKSGFFQKRLDLRKRQLKRDRKSHGSCLFRMIQRIAADFGEKLTVYICLPVYIGIFQTAFIDQPQESLSKGFVRLCQQLVEIRSRFLGGIHDAARIRVRFRLLFLDSVTAEDTGGLVRRFCRGGWRGSESGTFIRYMHAGERRGVVFGEYIGFQYKRSPAQIFVQTGIRSNSGPIIEDKIYEKILFFQLIQITTDGTDGNIKRL